MRLPGFHGKKMIDIKEYLKKKTARTEEHSKEFARQIRSHRLKTLLRTVAIAAVAVAVIAALYIQIRNQVYSGYVLVSSQEKEHYEQTEVLGYQQGFLTYSKDGISYTDYHGNAMWNQTYEMQSPMVEVRDSWVAVGDYNGHIIYDIASDGTVQEIDTNLPIRKLAVSANGVVAATLEESDVTWINVYNPNGERAVSIKTTMQKSGYPMSLSLSDNGKLMQVAYLRAESGSMKAVVSFYNFGEVGQNYTDTMVSSYEYADSVIPYTAFLNPKTAFCVADNQLMIFADEGAEIPKNIFQSFLSEEIQDIYHSDTYIGLVFLNEEGNGKYRLDVYNREGDKVLEKVFDMEYREILFLKDGFLIYNEGECIICNMQGKEKYAGEIPEQTLLLKLLSGRRFLTVTQNSVDVMEMR